MALNDAPGGSIVNLGTGIGTSVNRVAEILIEKIRPGIVPEHVPSVPGEPGDSVADVSNAEKLIGWRAEKKLEEAIVDAIEWNRTNL